MSRHASFFAAARQVAQESTMTQKLGAVIVKGSRIIGRGRNQHIRCVSLDPFLGKPMPRLLQPEAPS